jgi:phosphatidate cytidylyltransferase
MLSQIMLILPGCFAVGAVFMFLANRHVSSMTKRRRWLKFASYAVIVLGVLACAALGRGWLTVLMFAIFFTGLYELGETTRRFSIGPLLMVWVIYVLLMLGSVSSARLVAPAMLAYSYLVVAAFDGFSQVVGQFLGKHSLVPLLSPAKTVEGFCGGIAAAVIVGLLVRGLTTLPVGSAATAALAISACALAGDLAASWVKRRAGIKDFSRLLPGHGGVLDRFDSFIGATGLLAPALILLTNRGLV